MASVQHTRRGKRLMGEINVVPYIDVMLVLLIIFMITAPLLTEGVKVQLPKAGAKPIILSIDAQGRLFLNYNNPEDEPLDADKVEAEAAAVLRRAPQTVVLVRGDYRVAYGEVVGAMTILQRAGADKVGFVTETPREKKR